MPGFFVAFEGPEGSGKSTQAHRVAQRLRDAGLQVLLTREPGGTNVGEQIRSILLDHWDLPIVEEAEALLFSAARAQHVREIVLPALSKDWVVICDRYIDSTFAYQGAGRGLPLDELRAVQRLATGGLMPDIRVLLDLPPHIGLNRRLGKFYLPERPTPDDPSVQLPLRLQFEEPVVNRLDKAELAFHRRVRKAYHELVQSEPTAWLVVDATKRVEEITQKVTASLLQLLRGGPRDELVREALDSATQVELTV